MFPRLMSRSSNVDPGSKSLNIGKAVEVQSKPVASEIQRAGSGYADETSGVASSGVGSVDGQTMHLMEKNKPTIGVSLDRHSALSLCSSSHFSIKLCYCIPIVLCHCANSLLQTSKLSIHRGSVFWAFIMRFLLLAEWAEDTRGLCFAASIAFLRPGSFWTS